MPRPLAKSDRLATIVLINRKPSFPRLAFDAAGISRPANFPALRERRRERTKSDRQEEENEKDEEGEAPGIVLIRKRTPVLRELRHGIQRGYSGDEGEGGNRKTRKRKRKW